MNAMSHSFAARPRPIPFPFLAINFACALLNLAAYGGGMAMAADVPASDGGLATLKLQPVADVWARAEPRWRDIANVPYDAAFRAAFSYAKSDVKLTYRRALETPYFIGHISARGLKPNFAYQMKLAGKPVGGPQGWGTMRSYIAANSLGMDASARAVKFIGSAVSGDDWANQQLGYANRWWDDTLAPSTNISDAHFRANSPAHTIYGYLFLGVFVTDAEGNAETDVRGDGSYHITWQDGQSSARKDVLLGTFPARQTSYGYAAPADTAPVTLWYERESVRAQPIQLASGTYHCRLLVTEEAFHTEGGEDGGTWQTVLATETTGDADPNNDVVFSIR